MSVIARTKFHRRKSPQNNRHYHKLNVRQNYPRRHMLANASRFRAACFSAISRKFSYTCTLHVVLSDAAALLHFPVSVCSRFTRTDGDMDGDADGAGRGFLSQKFLSFKCTQDISRAEGINGPYPGAELHQRCNVRPRTTRVNV